MLPLDADTGTDIVEAARKQVGVTVTYDPAYVSLGYPGGDVPEDRGVSTDVLVRALRAGLKAGLQKLLHEDMRGHFSVYPKNWGLSRTDRSIDHRRLPYLQTCLKRRGFALALPRRVMPPGFQPETSSPAGSRPISRT